MRTGYGGFSDPYKPLGGSYPGSTPWSSPGGGDASTGSDTAADGGSGSNGGGDGGTQSFKRGGPVRKTKKQRRKRRIGYADGGSVNPLLMSVSLDSRSKNPAHYAEDEESLSTRPGGAPKAPNEFGYAEGGDVEPQDDDIKLEDWIEPPATPDEPEQPPEEPPPEEPEQPPEQPEQPPEEPEQSQQQQPDEQEQAPEDGGGGGGAGQQTGYNAQRPPEEPDQGEQPPDQTGYNQQQPSAAQSAAQSALQDVLDYTRQTMGVSGSKKAAPAPEQPPDQQQAAADETAKRIPVPASAPGTTGSERPDENATDTRPPAQQSSAAGPDEATGGPKLPKLAGARQPTGTASGQGNKQVLQEYMAGARGYSPDEMTQLLDRTNQTNPNLDQSGSIRTAFEGLVKKGDTDGASRFLQALRPSYDSVRALLIAATAKGDYTTAMQLAGRMNNLIPNGQQVRFDQTPDGRILATLQPEDGGPPVQHVLTPEQFARYANSPLSLFDHTAEQGLDKNFTLLTGQPGQTGGGQPDYAGVRAGPGNTTVDRNGNPINLAQAGAPNSLYTPGQGWTVDGKPLAKAADQTLAGTQYAAAATPNTGGVVSDARPNVPAAPAAQVQPGPGWTPKANSPGWYEKMQGMKKIITKDPTVYGAGAAPAAPAARGGAQAPTTGYSPQDRAGLIQQGQRILDEQLAATQQRVNQSMPPRPGQQPGQQQPGQQQPGQPGQQQPGQPPQGQQPYTPALPPKPVLRMPQRQAPQYDESAEHQAWRMFPSSAQRGQRARYQQQIENQRARAGTQQTPEQKAAIEQYRQENLNYRAAQVASTNTARIAASRDNNWITTVSGLMKASQGEMFREMMSRYKIWGDSVQGKAGVPYQAPSPEIAARDQALMSQAMSLTFSHGIDFTRGLPSQGGQQQLPQTAPAPRQPAPQQAPAQDRYIKTYPSNKDAPTRPPPEITLQPGEHWLQGNKGNWRIAPATPARQ